MSKATKFDRKYKKWKWFFGFSFKSHELKCIGCYLFSHFQNYKMENDLKKRENWKVNISGTFMTVKSFMRNKSIKEYFSLDCAQFQWSFDEPRAAISFNYSLTFVFPWQIVHNYIRVHSPNKSHWICMF